MAAESTPGRLASGGRPGETPGYSLLFGSAQGQPPAACGIDVERGPPIPAGADAPAVLHPIMFGVPANLSRTETGTIRLLAIGSCFLEDLLRSSPDGLAVDFILANEIFQFPSAPPREMGEYDYQVVQIPLRVIIRDGALARLNHRDGNDFEAAFARSLDALRQHLACVLQWNVLHGTPTFVMNFMEPQFATFGRLQPRFDLSDPGFFVQKLNAQLSDIVASHSNVFILDVDRLAASFGRRYVQDDSVNAFNHNAVLPADLRTQTIMNDPGPLSLTYDLAPGAAFRSAIVEELRAMHRTIRRLDAVKLVIVDLDDTAWIGVSGDSADLGPHMVEGWPGGFIEALHAIGRRDVLLAIANKNEESSIRAVWDTIVGPLLLMDWSAS